VVLLAENHNEPAAAAATEAHVEASADHAKPAEHATDAVKHDAHPTNEAAHEGGHGHGHAEPVLTYASIGLVEVMIFLGFFGSFLFIVLTTLSKNRLVPINHPMLEESLRHNI
jgi:hypothetical protein